MTEAITPPAQGVGPFYKPDEEKPTATVSKDASYENVHVLPQTPQLIALLTWVVSQTTFIILIYLQALLTGLTDYIAVSLGTSKPVVPILYFIQIE
jgi:hypothetical protein